MWLLFIPMLSLIHSIGAEELIKIICSRNPSLPYCPKLPNRILHDEPLQQRKYTESSENINSDEAFKIEEEISTLAPVEDTTKIPYPVKRTTPLPRQNILYTLFPTLQKNHREKYYCPANKYTFQVTCAPQKKLRYDLQVFCQEYADICGVPNTNLYPSRTGRNKDAGRPEGYGQKQKNGNFGLGTSFAFGTGMLPGFSVEASQGADIGHENLPFLNQIGGIMMNQGVEIGATGKRIGKGPGRTIDALDRGFPTGNAFFNQGDPSAADRRATGEFLRSFGLPNVTGLGKILKSLSPPRPNRLPSRGLGYEPGYGALDQKAPLAFGKVDHDSVNLPGGLGDFEINKGSGLGFGK